MSDDVTPGRYRHFKGNDYEVLLVARDVETEEPVVVYQALYGERGHWVRTLADFTAHVSRDGYDGPRFVRTGGVGGQPWLARAPKRDLPINADDARFPPFVP
ncbi:DUF1653 domain-containing protein [Curtobacterium pusillum]|uniref:DUF1653 domain-containing protein n=1 Tax=Curtobacterium pusillum TaxID=69373 RepID=UPI0021B4038E|nr:DUF1653 domain-containing protein [Curtobacterium pusillum]